MSIKLMSQVWDLLDPKLKDARLLTLLALADHANDENMCWPSIPKLAQRARVSDRQVQRVLQWLINAGYIRVQEKGNGRGNVTLYEITLKDVKLSPISEKGDMVSPNDARKDDKTSPINDIKGDNLSPIETLKGDIGDIKGDIGEPNYSHARREPSLEPPIQPTTETTEIAADAAPPPTPWVEYLEAFCWICHGHKEIGKLTEKQKGALTVEAKRLRDDGYTLDDLRTWFQEKWKTHWKWTKDKKHERPLPSDVRSMIPVLRDTEPEPTNGYHIDIPGVHALEPPAQVVKPPPLPVPLAHDDPWAIALAELLPVLPGRSAQWLEGSTLTANGELAGIPFYRITAKTEPSNIGWLVQQAEPAIRKKLSGLMGKRIEIEIVAMEAVA